MKLHNFPAHRLDIKKNDKANLHLPVAVLFPPKSQFSLSQPFLKCFKSLGVHAAAFCVVLHNSKNKHKMNPLFKPTHKRLSMFFFLQISSSCTSCTLTFPSVPLLMQHCVILEADQLHQVGFLGLLVDHLWQRGLLLSHQPGIEVLVMCGQY